MSADSQETGLTKKDTEFIAPDDNETNNLDEIKKQPASDVKQTLEESNRRWGEYLRTTGFGERVLQADAANPDITQWDPEVRAAMIDMIEDLSKAYEIQVPNTGNLAEDARSFFTSTEQEDMLKRLDNNENPEQLVKEFIRSLEQSITEAQDDPNKKKWVYTAIRTKDELNKRLLRAIIG